MKLTIPFIGAITEAELQALFRKVNELESRIYELERTAEEGSNVRD